MARYKITENMIENEDYIICKICNKKFRYLTSHLKIHNLSIEDYLNQFPDSLIKSANFIKDRADSIRTGCQKKYGVDNVGQLQSVKDKNKEYFNNKYGSDSYMSTNEFKIKSLETIQIRYNVDNVMKDNEIKIKCFANYNKSMLEKYNIEYGFQSEEIWLKGMHTNSSVKQNKPEKFIESLSDKIKYTGDHKFWVTFKDGTHKNPDFIIEPFKETKKVIEFAGNYWHNEEEMNNILNKYSQLNIDCLLIWESDFYQKRDQIIELINNFIS